MKIEICLVLLLLTIGIDARLSRRRRKLPKDDQSCGECALESMTSGKDFFLWGCSTDQILLAQAEGKCVSGKDASCKDIAEFSQWCNSDVKLGFAKHCTQLKCVPPLNTPYPGKCSDANEKKAQEKIAKEKLPKECNQIEFNEYMIKVKDILNKEEPECATINTYGVCLEKLAILNTGKPQPCTFQCNPNGGLANQQPVTGGAPPPGNTPQPSIDPGPAPPPGGEPAPPPGGDPAPPPGDGNPPPGDPPEDGGPPAVPAPPPSGGSPSPNPSPTPGGGSPTPPTGGSPTPPTGDTPEGESLSSTGAIIGGVAGGATVLGSVGFFLLRRRRNSETIDFDNDQAVVVSERRSATTSLEKNVFGKNNARSSIEGSQYDDDTEFEYDEEKN